MRTVVVSDLHLGATSGADLARRPDLRAPLIEYLRDGVDRLVVLGDALELREGPVRAAAEDAKPFLSDAGEALGPDGEIILAGGNHDHNLIAGWTEMHLAQDEAIGLEHRITPHDAGPIPEALAAAARPARLEFAYPGLWLRDDVYALHGHYLDLHTTVPTIERLAAGAMARAVSPIPQHGAEPGDYEAALAPLYAWMYALAQRSNDSVARAGSKSSTRAWVALAGEGRRRRPIRAAALSAALFGGVKLLNLAGVGPVEAKLSGQALRQGSLNGMGEVLRRLGVGADHVLFGHTHRSGPWPSDNAAEWRTPSGVRLMNTGSWVYQRHFLSERSGEGPYWPGVAIVVDDEGPPRHERFLADRTHEELRPARG
jgi:predicted phosphodiesterase